MTILVTGGCGFIGTNFIHRVLSLYPNERIVNIDKLTYAGNRANHDKYKIDPRYIFLAIDINDTNTIRTLINNHKPNTIVHFAAESHVDNSIKDASPFITTNVMGTYNLLECARKYMDWDYKFIHVSTDEVYGSLYPGEFPFTESSPYDPRSPYSASKAASDHIASAYYHTHNIPVIITNCSNNYGPYQFPEKFIPVIISKAMNDEKIPVYGTGDNIRDWIYVTDHCDALLSVIWSGKPGEKYNIGGECELDNMTLVKKILSIMGKSEDLIEFVEDRKGHDFRYAIDNMKINRELQWKPTTPIDRGLKQTVEWYMNNETWLNKVKYTARFY
jgi:dTDP-glucose 4,6-dehydratase